MKAQPMIASKEVSKTAEWYCKLLDAKRGHGGNNYEQILSNNELILQIHDENSDNHHESLVDGSFKIGNGFILWFESDDFESLLDRVKLYGFQLDRGPVENPNAKQMEIWLHDPNGYEVVIAGPSEYKRNPLEL